MKCTQNSYKAIAASNHPQERILSVTRWFISTLWGSYASRCTDGSSEKKPYNPILGEQFHCSLEDIKCVCEQVCHLPPISAFYLENEKAGVSLNGHCGQKSKFKGTAIKVEQVGRATLYLKQYDEQYMINFPDLLIRGVLSGSCYLELSEISTIASTNGSKAVIEFLPKPWFGGEHNHIRGSIMWNGITTLRGDLRLLFDAEAEPMAQRVTLPHDDQQEIESHRLWGRVTRALKAKNYQAANAQKTRIEEWQRKLRQERAERNETWAPALFNFQPDQQAKDEYTRRNVLLLKSMEGKPLLDDGAWIFKHSLHKRTF
ncbi:Oxysterol binding protein [Apophysomyces ossiformis]|uniref:Oxysterol binding protein n=1 Tax=Apophysomyces ossiformis TaxID=679940 RepID=A0A8H7BF75_9FUNG|nr:Oxysterol binding protein [Apophysomyces ossiformis]